jgi:four helix bundle protein
MNFDEWASTVPSEISADALWQMTVYRQALFAGELAWHDATKLTTDSRTTKLAAQLYDAVGGISATIAEGYSRGSERDQARFYEYALGSAREARDWYYKARHVLGSAVFAHRTKLLVTSSDNCLNSSHRTAAKRSANQERSTTPIHLSLPMCQCQIVYNVYCVLRSTEYAILNTQYAIRNT